MNANDSTLPAEFEEGPWIDAQQLMEWINIKTGTLKSWRRRGIVWYSNLGGKILYNKPWILDQLRKGWTCGKRPK